MHVKDDEKSMFCNVPRRPDEAGFITDAVDRRINGWEAAELRGRKPALKVRYGVDRVRNGSERVLIGMVRSNMADRKPWRKIIENIMENIVEKIVRKHAVAFSVGLLVAAVGTTNAYAQNMRTEAEEHPRIERAIHDLEDAIAYMEAAPNNFGGHKGAAINAARAAVNELRASLMFRAEQDRR
jgi:hypothetical protein